MRMCDWSSDVCASDLNGSRLPYDGFAQATDVAVIPTAAIDRIEVLLDGASAIYGSDAVGGVANIILKRDYDGMELSGRYGVATDGGSDQRQVTAVGGRSWDHGGDRESVGEGKRGGVAEEVGGGGVHTTTK